MRRNILILGEQYDIDFNETRQVVESATCAMNSAIEDEQENQQDVDEWEGRLDLLGAEFGLVRASFVQAVGQREAASRIIACAQYRVETGQVQANEATQRKHAFLGARDEKNIICFIEICFFPLWLPAFSAKSSGLKVQARWSI